MKKKFPKYNKSSLLLGLLVLAVLVGTFATSFWKIKSKTTNNQIVISSENSVPDELDREAFTQYSSRVSGDFEKTMEAPVFEGKALSMLPQEINSLGSVLGQSVTADDGSEKWIKISIAEKKLYAMEGERVVYEMPISSGRPGYPTIKGEFRVYRKTRYQRYLSRNPANPYNLPNVPCSMFFKGGYAIHGAYWHNDFGVTNRSSGCVNVSVDNACTLYEWAGPDTGGKNAVNSSSENPGVRVVVY